MRKLLLITASAFCLLLVACGGEEKTGVSYSGYNDTDKNIVSIIVNGEGGVLHATAHGGGAQTCCVLLPNKWRPGLKASIKWQEGGRFQFDENGNQVYVNGVPVVIEGPWKERTVDLPEYKEIGMFFIHFFPDDEIKVVVSRVYRGHPDYPILRSTNSRQLETP